MRGVSAGPGPFVCLAPLSWIEPGSCPRPANQRVARAGDCPDTCHAIRFSCRAGRLPDASGWWRRYQLKLTPMTLILPSMIVFHWPFHWPL
jgi:hypothetical protein